MDRWWLLTSTTYGTWMPGDDRGFVSNVRDGDGPEVRHNVPGTPCDTKMRGLRMAATAVMNGPAVYFGRPHARPLLDQFLETSQYRGWQLEAVAVMDNHAHWVVGVPGDPEPDTLLRDLESVQEDFLGFLG